MLVLVADATDGDVNVIYLKYKYVFFFNNGHNLSLSDNVNIIFLTNNFYIYFS